jgi:hypothetical protein
LPQQWGQLKKQRSSSNRVNNTSLEEFWNARIVGKSLSILITFEIGWQHPFFRPGESCTMLQRLRTKRSARIFTILSVFLFLFSLNSLSVFSQEPSPIPIDIPTELPSLTPLPPTETATTTFTELPSPTATNTEAPSSTPTETMVVLTETPTETPTLSLTETPTASLEATTSATPTGTFTSTPTSGLPTSTPIGQTPSFLNPSKPNTSFSPFSIVIVPVDSVSELIDALANADCGDETVIEMDPGTPLYTLTDVYDSSFFGNNGLPIIECNVTINGNGTTLTRSVNADPFRLFGVDSGATLTINDLALTNGSPSETGGGAILSVGGTVNVNRSYILNNVIDFETGWQTLGAGIYVYYGDLTITDSEIAGNHNLAGNSFEDLGDGGGIASISGTVTVSGVDFHDNLVSRDGSAAAILDNSTVGAHINDGCIVGNADISVFANWGLDAGSNWWGNSAGPLVDLPSTGTRDSINSAVTANSPLSTRPDCGVPPPICGGFAANGAAALTDCETDTPTPSPTPTLTPTQTAAPSTWHISCSVAGGAANARNFPSAYFVLATPQIDGQLLMTVPAGTVVNVYEFRADSNGVNWARITDYGTYYGETVWVRQTDPSNNPILEQGTPTACSSQTLNLSVTPQPTIAGAIPTASPGCASGNVCPLTGGGYTDAQAVAWILACEAGNGNSPEERADALGIAHVIRNRMRSLTFEGEALEVVSQQTQFDCWSQGASSSSGLNTLNSVADSAITQYAQTLVQGGNLPDPFNNGIHWYGLYTYGLFSSDPNRDQIRQTPTAVVALLSPICTPPGGVGNIYIDLAPFGSRVNATAFFSSFPNC